MQSILKTLDAQNKSHALTSAHAHLCGLADWGQGWKMEIDFPILSWDYQPHGRVTRETFLDWVVSLPDAKDISFKLPPGELVFLPLVITLHHHPNYHCPPWILLWWLPPVLRCNWNPDTLVVRPPRVGLNQVSVFTYFINIPCLSQHEESMWTLDSTPSKGWEELARFKYLS